MRKISILLLLLSTTLASWAQSIPSINDVGPSKMPQTIAPIEAPFNMPQLARPDFGKRKATVRSLQQSTSDQSITANTHAIQVAINKMSAKGGGTVNIPKGTWHVGRIELKSGVCLNVPEGAELAFSGKIKHYQPAIFTRDEGIELYSLGACIYANNARKIGLTGRGVLSGPSTDCEIFQQNEKLGAIEEIVGSLPLAERKFDGISTPKVLLPKTFSPINCEDVLIEGVTLRGMLYWNIVPQYCDRVIIRGVTVESHGHGRTDGVDLESSRNVLVEYCDLDCQDDCYTMKSGRGIEGYNVGKMTENVVIRWCLARRGAGGLVCGSETAAGMKNIYMHDCVFNGTGQGFRFKTRRPRCGGADHVWAERIRMNVIGPAFYCDMLGSKRWVGDLANRLPARELTQYTPSFHDIILKDVVVEQAGSLCQVTALPESPLRNVTLTNWDVNCNNYITLSDVSNFIMQKFTVKVNNTAQKFVGCKDVVMDEVEIVKK